MVMVNKSDLKYSLICVIVYVWNEDKDRLKWRFFLTEMYWNSWTHKFLKSWQGHERGFFEKPFRELVTNFRWIDWHMTHMIWVIFKSKFHFDSFTSIHPRFKKRNTCLIWIERTESKVGSKSRFKIIFCTFFWIENRPKIFRFYFLRIEKRHFDSNLRFNHFVVCKQWGTQPSV